MRNWKIKLISSHFFQQNTQFSYKKETVALRVADDDAGKADFELNCKSRKLCLTWRQHKTNWSRSRQKPCAVLIFICASSIIVNVSCWSFSRKILFVFYDIYIIYRTCHVTSGRTIQTLKKKILQNIKLK